MRRYFLHLAYAGTEFHGWQRQPNASSVQQTIEDCLSTMLRRQVEITGAGRTDTGVHASEMYAHFDAEEDVETDAFLRSLNNMVGHDIAIKGILPVRPDAHARFDAVSRTYQYHVTFEKDPFKYEYAHRMREIQDIDAMNVAAARLLETSDFTSFAKLHSDAKTNICRVSHAMWTHDEGSDSITFEITADRFLRNMVRAIVGTLIEVGTGKRGLESFEEVIKEKDRCAAGISVPAKGLFLTKIVYPKGTFL